MEKKFNAFLYLEPVQRFENMVRVVDPGDASSCNNSTRKCIVDMSKAI